MLPSSSSSIISFLYKSLIKPNSRPLLCTMSTHSHVFAGNPIRSRTPKPSEPFSPQSAHQTLKSLLLSQTHEPISPDFKVLPFRKGRPLAGSATDGPKWHLGWLNFGECKTYLENSKVGLGDDSLVYLGCNYNEDVVYWAIDVSDASGLVNELGARQFCFVELRTLMVATDWADSKAMGELAVAGHAATIVPTKKLFSFWPCDMKEYVEEAGQRSRKLDGGKTERIPVEELPLRLNCICVPFRHSLYDFFGFIMMEQFSWCSRINAQARALLEWHNTVCFCGYCGEKTVSMEAGRRKQCSNELCKKRIYPRVDPVVIMLVIDKENDHVLLSRQSRFVPRMWSCLAGFIEPGESLEEAVRRETWEETGIEVGEVVYHSSQPWPVGPSSMPCQLMVGFFAYAKTLDINVDKEELEDAKWHSREDVKKALTFAEYKKAQKTAADKVEQMCKGVEKGQNLSSDFNVESGELAPMFVPGPFAIAHHLISSWANPTASLSNL